MSTVDANTVNAAPDLIVRQEGRAGRLTLNRPQQLNALTLPMIHGIVAALKRWATDPAIEVVIIDGAGDKAFCAGGDIVSLYDASKTGPAFAAGFWQDEYRLNAMIHRYPKPYVAIMDGFVMGGGVGLSAHARFRIVTEKSIIAMPETTIGLIPDVGGSWLLSRAQGRLGAYLGLTGYRMSGSDAIQAGFADTYLPRADIPPLIEQLVEMKGVSVLDILDSARDEHPVPPSPLAENRAVIDKVFAGRTVAEVHAGLLTTTHELAQRTQKDLATRSPLACALTLEAIARAKSMKTLENALAMEYRLVNNLYQRGEFIEGIRALLIDKDKAPKWKPERFEGVTADVIATYFAAPPTGDMTW